MSIFRAAMPTQQELEEQYAKVEALTPNMDVITCLQERERFIKMVMHLHDDPLVRAAEERILAARSRKKACRCTDA